uniref:Uncharacterized protein n=1 Tax=Pararge aegeria TaxID=116150 RepID=S4PAV3_9NEOP
MKFNLCYKGCRYKFICKTLMLLGNCHHSVSSLQIRILFYHLCNHCLCFLLHTNNSYLALATLCLYHTINSF